MLHADRIRAESFGDLPELYDRARPRYPEALVDDLLASPTTDVLDVGCGTGIAAAQLAARGVDVLGVEIDERMAAVARLKGLAVEVAPFEVWDDAGRRFDLVTSAQAWHWIDPQAGLRKAAAVLRPRGRIAVFWNFGDPPEHVLEPLRAVYRRLAPELAERMAGLGEGTQRQRNREVVEAFEHSGLFEAVEVRLFRWRARYGTQAWIDFLGTHSHHHTLAPERREPLLAALAETLDEVGNFEVEHRTVLVTAAGRG